MEKIMDKPVEQSEPKRMPPILSLTEEDLPEIKKWRVGETYKILLDFKQVSSSIDEYSKDKKHSARFQIAKVKAVDGSASSQDFKEFEKSYSEKEE